MFVLSFFILHFSLDFLKYEPDRVPKLIKHFYYVIFTTFYDFIKRFPHSKQKIGQISTIIYGFADSYYTFVFLIRLDVVYHIARGALSSKGRSTSVFFTGTVFNFLYFHSILFPSI